LTGNCVHLKISERNIDESKIKLIEREIIAKRFFSRENRIPNLKSGFLPKKTGFAVISRFIGLILTIFFFILLRAWRATQQKNVHRN